jgi:hypothetical protein
VERNYAAAYIRSILPEMCAVLGPADAASVGNIAARQIAMQYHGAVMDLLDGDAPFTERFARLLRAHGDDVDVSDSVVRVGGWSLMDGVVAPPEAFDAWNGLWQGLAAMEDCRLSLVERADLGDASFAWRVQSRQS